MRLCMVVILAACSATAEPEQPWALEGVALTPASTQVPPPTQALSLDVGYANPGEDVTFTVTGLNPSEEVYILRGADIQSGGGPCLSFAGGFCVDLLPPVSPMGPVAANSAGLATLTVTLPPGAPVGASAGFQAIALRGPQSVYSEAQLGTVEAPMTLSSPDVQGNSRPNCDIVLPQQYWCNGPNPELAWSNVPANTVELMYLYRDVSINFPHWYVAKIDPSVTGIARGASGTANMPAGSYERSYASARYAGSCSGGNNTYEWRLVALDAPAPAAASGTFQSRFSALQNFANSHMITDVTICQQ